MLMRIFLAIRHPGALDRPTAMACLMANVMVLPGLGSWIAGRKTGLFQMLFALSGLFFSCFWLYFFVRSWIHLKQFPSELGPHFTMALIGLSLFAFAWLWALATSASILRTLKSR